MKFTPLVPIDMAPMIRLGYEYSNGDVFEAYTHPDDPDSRVVINRTAQLRRHDAHAEQQSQGGA